MKIGKILKSLLVAQTVGFYKKEMRPQCRNSIIAAIISVGIALPELKIVGTYFSSGDRSFLFLDAAVLVSCFAILILSGWGK